MARAINRSSTFHAASLNYIEHLRADAHFVVECEHTGGPGVPPPDQPGDPPPFEALFDFILDHPRWYDGTSPYQRTGLPPSFPSDCVAQCNQTSLASPRARLTGVGRVLGFPSAVG
ncbi:MAG: hypothetical protein K0V04_06020, partial [Deltaproteobacteria bacterium]|nr:hypothetical protein [Deltaproteobacteria bacterium]